MDTAYWIDKGVHIIFGLILMFLTLFVAHSARNVVYSKAKKDKNHDRSFALVTIGHSLYYTILVIGSLLVLRIFGVEIASIVAVISAIAFAIGLSLQGSLSDISSGILITFFNVYSIGDIVAINDKEGKVLDFKLIHTVLEDLNTKSIVTVPNRMMQGEVVFNLTKQGYHYFVIDILVSNKNKDFNNIRAIIRGGLKDAKNFPDVLQTMPHRVSVLDMGGVGTKMRVRVPVTTDGDIAVKRGDIRNALRALLESKGIVLIDPSAISA